MNKRREFIKQLAGGALLLSSPALLSFIKENNIPVRAITKGPEYHWFSYYDKLQFDPTNRYVLGMQVDFEFRSPLKNDVIKLGYIDLHDNDRWVEFGESRAWGWQQGCMLQWIPGSGSEVIWNDRRGDKFISIIKNIKTGHERVIDKAIYSLGPDGVNAVSTDFERIQDYRKGYGYPGVNDKYKHQNAPEDSGIYHVNLETGVSRLIISYHDILNIPYPGGDISGKWHWFNHLLVSPDGDRFIFLNRWKDEPSSGGRWLTRMFTANIDGSDVYLLDPSGQTSHFIWKDSSHITAWTRPAGKEAGFWEFRDKTSQIRQIGEGVMTRNGHNTYVPGTNNDWILNDTYPQSENREQIVYMFQQSTGKKVELGRFHSPPEYTGEWRCDTHPRSSNDGKLVSIDSTHEGNGRQIYLIDISQLI
ncbi:MAG: hypothetical protein ACOCUP_03410 [bacterium]